MKLFTPFDFFIVIFIVFVAIFTFFSQDFVKTDDNFLIFADDEKFEIPLSCDTVIFIASVKIELKNQTAKIVESDCPNQICVESGAISSNGQIVCVPNKVVVCIRKKNTEVDVYAH
jgi:hypothetical protein